MFRWSQLMFQEICMFSSFAPLFCFSHLSHSLERYMAMVGEDVWYIDHKGYRSQWVTAHLVCTDPQRSVCKTLTITLHVLRHSNLECVYAIHARNSACAVDLQESTVFVNVGVCVSGGAHFGRNTIKNLL